MNIILFLSFQQRVSEWNRMEKCILNSWDKMKMVKCTDQERRAQAFFVKIEPIRKWALEWFAFFWFEPLNLRNFSFCRINWIAPSLPHSNIIHLWQTRNDGFPSKAGSHFQLIDWMSVRAELKQLRLDDGSLMSVCVCVCSHRRDFGIRSCIQIGRVFAFCRMPWRIHWLHSVTVGLVDLIEDL